jgi:hypothetical protein
MEKKGFGKKKDLALNNLRCRVMQKSNDMYYSNDNALTRILVARNYDVDDAFEMWTRWFKWRRSYLPHCITESQMIDHIHTGKAFFHGGDKQGRPCLIVRARFHFPNQFTAEETLRYSIYLAEKASNIADSAGTGQICMIYDRGGITDDNQDPKFISLIREMAEVFKDFYAERLAALFILHVSVFHWIMYQAVKVTIPKKTREKIHVMRNLDGLLEYFEPENLMKEYGGIDEYVHQN